MTNQTPPRILIVEDEGLIAAQLERALTGLGYQVTAAVPTGEAALQSVAQHPPDLVLMDIVLGSEMDGIETADRIHDRCDLPIVYLTAYAEQTVIDAIKHTQPYGFLTKPVRRQQLGATVEMALYKHDMETRLRQSEQRYRLLFDHAGIGIGYYTLQGTLLSVNKIAARYLGARAEDLVGQTVFDLFGEQAGAVCLERIRAAAQSTAAGEYQDRLALLGKERWVFSSYAAVRDTAGAVTGVQIISHDITERVEAEEELRLFKTIVETSHEAIAISDTEGQLIYINPAHEKLFGRSLEEARTLNYRDYYPPESVEILDRKVAPALDRGESWEGELDAFDADGRRFPLWERADSIHDADGTLRFAFGLMHDISDRTQAQQALRQSEERFNLFMEHLPGAVSIKDSEERVVYVNERFAQIIGQTPQDLIGLGSEAITPPELIDQYHAENERVLQGETVQSETVFPGVDGPSHWLTYKFPLCCQGEPALVGTISLDITARKRAEQALQQAHARLLTILDSIDADIYVADMDTHEILFLNRHMRDSFGEDVVGRRCWDVFAGGSGPCAHCTNDQLLDAEGQPAGTVDWQGRNPVTGRWYINRDRAIYWIDGRIVRIQTAIDVTERVQAEEALRESEMLLSKAEEMAHLGSWAWDMQRDLFTLSEGWQRVHGCSTGQLTLQDIFSLVYPQDRDRVEQALTRALKARQPYDIEHRIIRPEDGEVRVVQARGQFIYHGERPVRMQGATQDVTERVQAEEALRQSSDRLQILRQIDAAILSAQSPEAIARVTLERLHDLIPYCWACVSEVDRTGERGRNVVLMAPDRTMQALTSPWYPLPETGALLESLRQGQIHLVNDLSTLEAPSHLEGRLIARGVHSYVSLPLTVRDALVGALSLAGDAPGFFQPDHVEILHEIAASLAIAMQQATLLAQTQRDAETKALLLHEVNHRVMNNLTMIQSMLELAMDQPRPRYDENTLHTVLQDLDSRIRGITTVHRMLANAEQDSLDPVQLTSAIIHGALNAAPIQCRFDVAVEAPEDLARISARQAVTLALIVNELTTNSVKYALADRTEGEIRAHLEQQAPEAKLRLVFRDDGPGWPDEVLAGERRSMGLWLIQTSVTNNLQGDIVWHNDGGAVVEIQFPVQPLNKQ